MRKSTGIFLIFLCITMIFVAGCTGPQSTDATTTASPTTQIVYVTVFVTPTPEVTSDVTERSKSENVTLDEAFLDYIDGYQIFEKMEALETFSAGVYSIDAGYNAEPKREAARLTALLIKAPITGSETMGTFRSAMMNALSMMDGTTAGFTRYEDAMQAVILAKNAAFLEMHSLGSTSVDAIHFSGHGDDALTFNTTETGPEIFTMHHTGDSNFAITLKDENRKYISLLVNEIGDYSGKKTENLTIGQYYLDVTADGDWRIGIATG